MSEGKRTLAPVKVITAQSLSASFNGPTEDVSHLDRLAIQLDVVAGDSNGNFYLQGSVDGLSWANLDIDAITPQSGNTPVYIEVTQIAAPKIRLAYVNSSGSTGTVSMTISGKES